MNLANTDYIQATIEIFGFIITLLVAMIFWIITGNEKKSEKSLFYILITSGFALLFDAGWYVYDGNTTEKGIILNYICNLLIFMCNPIMVQLMNRYLHSIIKERELKINRLFGFLINIFSITSLILPITNIFYKWMYYFDGNNVYCRMFGWNIYAVINSLGIFTCLFTVVAYRRYISKFRRTALYIFLIAPFVGIALQTVILGISFIQIGIAIGSLGIISSYLVEWIQKEKNDNDISEEKRRLWLIECVFAIMILFVSAAIISCVVSVYKVSNKNSEQSSMSLTFMVSETVDGALHEPIVVSETMSKSDIVIEALSTDNLEGTDTEARMIAFMKRIQKKYGYQMIFVASDKTKAYYTYEGFSRYMKVDTDVNDAWYNEFKAREIEYELNIDADKDNDMALAVFVNMEVRDEEDNLIGVCGVAMSIESLMDIMAQYEDAYSLDIALVDPSGIIQVDTDRGRIEQSIPFDIDLSDNSESIHYQKDKIKTRLVKYMSNLDWYLVIDDMYPNKLNIFEIIRPSMVIYILGIVLMIAFSVAFGVYEKKRNVQLRMSKHISETDGLTGLKNRYSMDRFVESKTGQKTPNAWSVVMIDINGLKVVNDNIGHDAGDELIKGAADCLVNVFEGYGEIYRTGGDEFVIISLCEEEMVKSMIDKLRDETNKWRGKMVSELSLSIGLAAHQSNPDSTFLELLKIADNEMYKDKNAYYARTGKDRRKR